MRTMCCTFLEGDLIDLKTNTAEKKSQGGRRANGVTKEFKMKCTGGPLG